MSDLRFRTFRMRIYAGLCSTEGLRTSRARMGELLDRGDEDGMEALVGELPLDAAQREAVNLLREARQIGERLSVMDRTLPSLPHAEIGVCYRRLRELADALDVLLAGRMPA
jgi:hypothetical protein